MDIGPHVTDQLSPYMDDELSAPERDAVAAHLRGCPSCARHLEELRAVDKAARELTLAVPDGYFDSFRGTLRQRLERARPARRRIAPAWTLAAAAALVLAVVTPRLLREPRVAPAPPVPTRAAPPAAPMRPEAAKAEKAAPPAATRSTREERQDGLADRGRLAKRDRSAASPPAVAPPATPAAPADASERQAQGYAAAPAEADSMAPAPPAQLKAEPEAARELESPPRDELKERPEKATRGGAATENRPALSAVGDPRFDVLRRRTASSAEEARALRDAWRAYARATEAGPRADEARVRAVEAGALAWRHGKDESDRARAQRDGREYLERPDALQRERIRDVLRSLSP